MKTTLRNASLLAVAGVALALSVQTTRADQPAANAKSVQTPTLKTESSRKAAGNNHLNPSAGTVEGKETGTLTGSHIQTTYTVHGHNTDAAQPVYVIERGDPRFDGHATVGGILHNLSFGTVRGGF